MIENREFLNFNFAFSLPWHLVVSTRTACSAIRLTCRGPPGLLAASQGALADSRPWALVLNLVDVLSKIGHRAMRSILLMRNLTAIVDKKSLVSMGH